MNLQNLIAGMLGFFVGFHVMMAGFTSADQTMFAVLIIIGAAIMATALQVLTLAIAGSRR